MNTPIRHSISITDWNIFKNAKKLLFLDGNTYYTKDGGRSQAMKDFQALLVDRDEDDIHRAHTARGKVRSNFFSHDDLLLGF